MVLGMMLAAAPARAACGAAGPTMARDFGLHRQWVVERDCAHPERPARLRAVPWDGVPARHAAAAPLLVRPGMRVRVQSSAGGTQILLTGTAVTGGRAGEPVLVRAGLHQATLQGRVCGPGRVELAMERRR